MQADFSWCEDPPFQSFIGGVIAFNSLLMGDYVCIHSYVDFYVLYVYVSFYVYVYIYIYICLLFGCFAGVVAFDSLLMGDAALLLVHGFYCNFNNLRFNKSQNTNDESAAHVVVYAVSGDIVTCRLLKWLLDHSMNFCGP